DWYYASNNYQLNYQDAVLYAIWEPITDTLTYKSNFDDTYYHSETGNAGTSLIVLDNMFLRSGYTFTGWNTKADGNGTAYTVGSSYQLSDGDDVLYAQWSLNPVLIDTSITYKSNGGNGTDQVYNGYVDDNVSVIDNPFDRNGYTFTGWNTRVDGSGTAYGAGDNYTLIDGDNVLYAQWKKNRPNHSTYTGEIPLTADESNIAVWIGICITSFIAMIGMILIKRQSKRQ
ncbi:MAG: InlB B-repeat-containing protein, partial [Solobacterium sp.]|nr:InlB B-repeat-containing protein [Solobacterium sp.]